MKRSQTISLVLLAGAGAAAFALARHDPSQDEEGVRLYADAAACTAERLRTEAACRAAEAAARAAYPTAAPRYPTIEACAAHHGPDACVPGGSVGPESGGGFLPRMAGFVVADDPALPPQPVFRHAAEEPEAWAAHSAGGTGGYCTGSGVRLLTTGGGRASAARVSSAALRGVRTGGFGGTGRGFASGGRGFGG